MVVEELVLSNQAQMERNETLTVQNEDLRGEFNEAVRRRRNWLRASGAAALHITRWLLRLVRAAILLGRRVACVSRLHA